MITITMPDGTKISGKKEEVIEIYTAILKLQTPIILTTGNFSNDYPMPITPWEPKVTWTNSQ